MPESSSRKIGWVCTITGLVIAVVGIVVAGIRLATGHVFGSDVWLSISLPGTFVGVVIWLIGFRIGGRRVREVPTPGTEPIVPAEQAQGFGWMKASDLIKPEDED